MQKSYSLPVKVYIAICAATGWFAVLLQLYLIITNRKLSITATVVEFFSYFTILTNILVAICLTVLLLRPSANRFFTKPTTLAAAAMNIAVVGIIYNTILRSLWNPQGWQLVADNLLHTLMPILFVVYWLIAAPKNNVQWKDIFSWLIYPFIYLVYVLIRGAITNLYPYPFVDVAKYGYAKVMMNSVWVMVGFILVSLLFIGLAKVLNKSASGK